jgi:hypothetical protein
MVTGFKVKFGEPPRASELFHELINDRKRIFSLDSKRIQMAIVDHKAPSCVFLLDKENRGTEGAIIVCDYTLSQEFLYISFKFILKFRRNAVERIEMVT